MYLIPLMKLSRSREKFLGTGSSTCPCLCTEIARALNKVLHMHSYKFRIAKYLIFTAAGLSLLLSVYLWFSGQREEGQFVGIWVPSILGVGALVLLSVRKDKA